MVPSVACSSRRSTFQLVKMMIDEAGRQASLNNSTVTTVAAVQNYYGLQVSTEAVIDSTILYSSSIVEHVCMLYQCSDMMVAN